MLKQNAKKNGPIRDPKFALKTAKKNPALRAEIAKNNLFFC